MILNRSSCILFRKVISVNQRIREDTMKLWCFTVCLLVSLLIFSGCKSKERSRKEVAPPTSVKKERKLPDEKKTLDKSEDKLQMPDTVGKLELGFNIGDTVSDFRLKDLNGNEVTLFQLLKDKPVMLEFGSYT